MPAKKPANNGDLSTKLNFLGLDIENVPEYLKDFNPLNFNISRLNNDKDHRIYRYVPIDEIEILVTPSLRSDDIRKKYSEAVPLGRFFNPQGDEEDIERYTTLLKILNTVSISDIENISLLQKSLEKTEPFKVKYNKDHLWQIYYSPSTDKYFMLVCTKEETYSEFLYLLKRKIEYHKKKTKTLPTIFVPINYVNYSEEFLNRDEISNIESYLWLFTKNWPLIFEVYDKKDVMSLQIVGDTYVYNNVKSFTTLCCKFIFILLYNKIVEFYRICYYLSKEDTMINIDEYIEKSKNMENTSDGGSASFIFGDKVLVC